VSGRRGPSTGFKLGPRDDGSAVVVAACLPACPHVLPPAYQCTPPPSLTSLTLILGLASSLPSFFESLMDSTTSPVSCLFPFTGDVTAEGQGHTQPHVFRGPQHFHTLCQQHNSLPLPAHTVHCSMCVNHPPPLFARPAPHPTAHTHR
jgi:hypothetical protein